MHLLLPLPLVSRHAKVVRYSITASATAGFDSHRRYGRRRGALGGNRAAPPRPSNLGRGAPAASSAGGQQH
jgi:hypothetical protein